MLAITQAEELAELKRQLSDYEQQRKDKNVQIESMEDTLERLQKKSSEIEDGLQETINTISRRLDQIPGRNKFRVIYLEQAKSKVMNPQSAKALEHTREAQRQVKSKLSQLEEEVKTLNSKIRTTEDQIWQLSQQLNQTEDIL